MSLLFRSAPPVETRGVRLPPDVIARMHTAGPSGVYVGDADTAMRHDAVWACVTKISQDVSMMPVDTGRTGPTGWVDVDPKPQIIAAPSALVEPLDWRYQVLASWLTAGNVWGLVTQTTPDGRFILRLELQAPRSIRIHPTAAGPEFFVDNEQHWLWPVGDLWHKPAYTMPGHLLGLSPIAYHAAKIGLGLTAEKFGADYLGDGGHPSALIQPAEAVTEIQATSIKSRFMDLTRGNRDPIVLPATTKYTPIQVNPQESMFLDTMRYTTNSIIARVFLEDPADYGSAADGGTSMTYANRSDADLARVKRRQFWITKLQSALSDLAPPGVIVRLNTSAALMMTTLERHQVHALRLKSETMTVNEVRRIEDEAPFQDPKFDQPGVPDLLNKPDPATTQGGAA